MVNASSFGVLRRLIVEMESAMADLHKYVSCAGELRIENDLAAEECFIKPDAPLDIGGEDMDMMNVANQMSSPSG